MSNATVIFQAISKSKEKEQALHSILKIISGGKNGGETVNDKRSSK